MKVNGVEFDQNILKVSPQKKAEAEQAFKEALAEKQRELAAAQEARGGPSYQPTAGERREEGWNSFLEKFKTMGIKDAIHEEMLEKFAEEAKQTVLEREGLDEEAFNNLPRPQAILFEGMIELEMKKLIVQANQLEVQQSNKELESNRGLGAENSVANEGLESTVEISTPSV